MGKVERIAEVPVLILTVLLLASCGTSGTADMPSTPPAPPGNVEVRANGDLLKISWDCVPKATHYTVFWGNEREEYRSLLPSEKCSLGLQGLKKGRFYAVAVTAWNQKGESQYSSEAAIVFDDDPAHASEYLEKGNDLMDKGNFADAHLYLSAAIRLDPENAAAYRRRGLLYEKTNQAALARQDYRSAELILKRKHRAAGQKDQPVRQ